jgi:predicted nucleic acid-binding protein
VIAYFDTSALVKLLVQEPGTSVAIRLWDEAAVRLTSPLSYVECRAALAAARPAGRLPVRSATAAIRELAGHWRSLAVVPVDDALIENAGEMTDRLGLRGYDAVHLASAARALPGPVTMVTWDADLAAAAHALGLAIAPRDPLFSS